MTIQQAIDRIDAAKPNMFDTRQKVEWLSALDGLVYLEIIRTHEGDAPPFTGYDEGTSLETTLLAPEPYTDVYQHYLAVQMDVINAESGKYAQDQVLFNAAWQTLADYWNRTRRPIARVKQFRL